MEAKNKELVQRYVSLLTNSGFKAVFGDRRNKDVVMSVINMLLPEGKQVRDIEYAPTEHQGPMLVSKEFQYDFMCKGTDGTAFIVEMQCYPENFWFRRCVSYASRAYDMQNRQGEEYDIAPVYLIGLMGIGIGTRMIPDGKKNIYRNIPSLKKRPMSCRMTRFSLSSRSWQDLTRLSKSA